MVSARLLNSWLLAILASSTSAQEGTIDRRAELCTADNLLNKLRHTPSVFVPFCQAYIGFTTYQIVTVATNFASTAAPTSLPYPSALTGSSYAPSRLSSACSCLSVPLTTQTVTKYITSGDISNTPTTLSSSAAPSCLAVSSACSCAPASTITQIQSLTVTQNATQILTHTVTQRVTQTVSTSVGQQSTQLPIPSGFSKIIFQDDFSAQTPGSLPSQVKWTIDTGVSYPGNDWGWGNQEQESYTAYTDNLVITPNGTLRITPLHKGQNWYSGRIETNAANDFSCSSGDKIRVEASLMLGDAPASEQQGIWPAFWIVGSAFRGNWNNWPSVGEIDMMETVNGEGQIYHNVHCGSSPGGPCNEPNGQGATVTFTRGVFHTISVDIDRTSTDWASQTLTFMIDGVQTFQRHGSDFQTQAVWESLASTSKMILLNVAVGGNWPGYANAQTIDGLHVAMDVKYVVVYSS